MNKRAPAPTSRRSPLLFTMIRACVARRMPSAEPARHFNAAGIAELALSRRRKRRRPTRLRESAFFAERETGFEPATSTLARWHSTTELLPQLRRFALRRREGELCRPARFDPSTTFVIRSTAARGDATWYVRDVTIYPRTEYGDRVEASSRP